MSGLVVDPRPRLPFRPIDARLLELQRSVGNRALSAELKRYPNRVRLTGGQAVGVQRAACCSGCAEGKTCEESEAVRSQGGADADVTSSSQEEGITLQRACGSAEIGAPTTCIGSSEESPSLDASPYRFNINCNDLKPGEEQRLEAAGSAAAAADTALTVHGFASIEGNPTYNADLSCARAERAGAVLEGVGAVVTELHSHGAVPGDRDLARSVAVEKSTRLEPPPPTECMPGAGFENSQCNAYAKENWWLPEAYVHNATCACQETPNAPTANCVRKFLQDRLGQVDNEVKVRASHYKGALMTRRISKDEYINFVQLELTPIIYKDHVDAYSTCCCPAGPAPLPAWRGVTTFALPCSTVGESIRQFGSCHGTPGTW